MIELTGHSGLVVALAYAPDGRTLASASADGTARLWNLATGRLVGTIQSPDDRAYCVAFAPDGKSVAVGYGGQLGLVQWWDLNPLRRRESWSAHPRATRGVAVSPDGKTLATAGDSPEVILWRLPGTAVHKLPTGQPVSRAVAFSPDGRRLAAVTARPAAVRVWTAADGRLQRGRKHLGDWGHAVAFAPDGGRLALGLERDVAVWDPADYRPPAVWPAHAGAMLGVAFTPDGRTLLTGGADGLVKAWDPDGRPRHTFDWKVGEVGAVAFAPDGLTAAAGGVGTILVWDVAE